MNQSESAIDMISIATMDQLQDAVRQHARIRVRGGGTKTALSSQATLELTGLSGVIEYEPSEYTFTALAGTRLSEIQSLLAQNAQFMPFDPVMVRAGATIGGAIAAGISGPGRFRYGGLRDFLLGVRLVNGEGDVVRGGGKVVKNAAGFDIPKLMVGSLGRFGVLTEATFKVFPRPEAYATVQLTYSTSESAFEDLLRVAVSPAEAACLEMVAPSTLLIRVGGIAAALSQRIDRIRQLCRDSQTWQVLTGDDDARIWDEAREFSWRPPDQQLVRMPIAPRDVLQLEARFRNSLAGPRRYSLGGHLLWVCWPGNEVAGLLTIASEFQRTAQPVLGHRQQGWSDGDNEFGQRLLSVFDPERKFA